MEQQTFTAAQIAAALRKTPQAIRQQLRDVTPAGAKAVAGNEASAWTIMQFPVSLRESLALEARKWNCSIESLLALPRRQWRPPVALANIHPDKITEAENLREALKPFLIEPSPGLSAEEWKQRGVDYYFRVFKDRPRITSHHWDRLLRRTQIRDNGCQNFNELAIYLPDRLKRKELQTPAQSASKMDNFAGLTNYIHAIKSPGQPDRLESEGLWKLALSSYTDLISAGELEKRAARQVRQFLFGHAAFLAPTRDALWVAFKRKIAALKMADGNLQSLKDRRADNGRRVEIAKADIDRLRHSAAVKNGGRVDAAWREEFPLLTEGTRHYYTLRPTAPAKIHQVLNREVVNALTARHKGKRVLRRLAGTIKRDWTGIYSMHSWVVDDMTSNIEVALKNADGTTSLIQPQLIAVMDSVSRKYVGWKISEAKAPNAGIVTDAVLEAIKTHGVPKHLGVENGFVFGKSLLVNGKEDEQGRTLVVGLGNFGCEVDHFEKMNPTSKSELEYAFHQIQCLMERHPGYGGRLQMVDAPEEFKREKNLINAGKADASQYRYTFDEFIVVLNKIILQYNATPQGGRLKGQSPDQCFLANMDANDPPIKFTPALEWMLNNEKERVTVKMSGVRFIHRTSRTPIAVRGGRLANLVGQDLWALCHRSDPSIVTFMTLDYRETFTMEICKNPSARESSIAPGSGVLPIERAKIREHERAVSEEYQSLKKEFGNPRQDLLAQTRRETSALTNADPGTRKVILNSRIENSAQEMEQQRQVIADSRKQRTANKSKARRLEIPSVLVGDDDDEQTRRALELMGEGPRRQTGSVESCQHSES